MKWFFLNIKDALVKVEKMGILKMWPFFTKRITELLKLLLKKYLMKCTIDSLIQTKTKVISNET